jgi:excinuclease ABC subunit A
LVSLGHSVLAVEHHLQFLAASDWIIDLGPGGGEKGGELIAEGTPEEVSRTGASVTGRFLSEILPAPSSDASQKRSSAATVRPEGRDS